MEGKVEKLGAADLDDLVVLERTCFDYHWTREQFLMGLEQGVYVILGIRSHRQLVGYVAFSIIEDEMEILNLAIHPHFRKQKLGTALMEAMLCNCRRRGVKKSFLDVKESNVPAIALYRKYGYEQYGVRRKYYPDTKEDALLFRYDFEQAECKG